MASEPVTVSPAPAPPPLEAERPLPGGPPPAGAERRGAGERDEGHIALILPLASAAFGRYAEAVKNGVLAAAKVQQRSALPLRIYSVTEDGRELVRAYHEALGAGARVVVGPLTREGVTAIASAPVPVPTLALNVPEPGTALPVNLYTLSLQVEAEAHQVARFAYGEGRRKALTVRSESALMRRLHDAFVEEFSRLGGAHIAEYVFSAQPGALARLREAAGLGVADMAFLALDFAQARLARPFLDPLALYASSQVNPGAAGPLASFELAGVRLLDMPWLLEPDHPAVMLYPRGGYRDAPDLERLYALGIDALRIAQQLGAGRTEVALDGVTGRIRLEAGQRFVRALTAAEFAQGRLVTLGAGAHP